MDVQTIVFLCTIIACFLGLAGWLTAREKKIANDGEWKGIINTKLDAILGITERVDSVEEEVKKHSERITKVETKLDGHLGG